MNKKNARDALDLYKKFLIRMDRVADFLKVAEVSFILNAFCHDAENKKILPFLSFPFFSF